MTHEIRKISKIVDELTTYFLMLGIKKIKSSILNNEDGFKIKIKLYDFDFNHPKINNVIEYLNFPRQREIEECYWELAGESDRDDELCLVGIMTDKVEIERTDSKLVITLYRNKV